MLRPHSRLCYRCYKLIELELLQSKQNIINGAHFLSLHGRKIRTENKTANHEKCQDRCCSIFKFIAVFAFNSQFISDKESRDKIWDQLRGHSSSLMIVRGAAW